MLRCPVGFVRQIRFGGFPSLTIQARSSQTRYHYSPYICWLLFLGCIALRYSLLIEHMFFYTQHIGRYSSMSSKGQKDFFIFNDVGSAGPQTHSDDRRSGCHPHGRFSGAMIIALQFGDRLSGVWSLSSNVGQVRSAIGQIDRTSMPEV